MNDDYPPLKQPNFLEKIIIALTVVLAAILVPWLEKHEGKQEE